MCRIDDRSKREVHESELLAFQEKYNAQHFAHQPPEAGPTTGAPTRAYTPGSLVVCKLANWPIANEQFFTRPVRPQKRRERERPQRCRQRSGSADFKFLCVGVDV